MSISTLLHALAACVCEQVQADDTPSLCFCGVVPGQQAIADYAGDCDRNGMAWVRLITSYPASGVGIQATDLGNCSVGIGFDVEVGVLRKYPTDPEGASEAELLASTDLQIQDMQATRRAILCCDAYNNKDFVLGAYQPMGPLGDLVGGAWTVYFME